MEWAADSAVRSLSVKLHGDCDSIGIELCDHSQGVIELQDPSDVRLSSLAGLPAPLAGKLTLTRSTLVKSPDSKPPIRSSVVTSMRAGKGVPLMDVSPGHDCALAYD